MPNLGNAWHIPINPEPRGRGGMREPIGSIVAGAAVTILSATQYQGVGGNPGNQLQDGSAVLFRQQTDATWTTVPMLFEAAISNNKYYTAALPADAFAVGATVQYYLRVPYSDHDTTFVHAAAGGVSATTVDESAAQGAPFTFTVESPAVKGRWAAVFALPNVAVHAHLLPDGHVLMWGRRDHPNQSLDVHECTPFAWTPGSGAILRTPQPTLTDGTKINLFCSGHTFLADGRLLVVGGHLADSDGLNQACIYDATANTWTATAIMNDGRWYPTATTLPDGRVLVLSGSFLQDGQTPNNVIPQVWHDGTWTSSATFPDNATFELYPRVHVTSDGTVVMSGPLVKTWSLNLAGNGQWTHVAQRDNARRDYCPSVMYDVDRVIYIGGGNDPGTHAPTANSETLDLNANPPRWQATAPMHLPRRQHNATLLPDGTVLVTGGTRGGGGLEPNPMGFNDLRAGQPVHFAELWDPATGQWTELAAESVDRCYHSTAVLLPDATVLSAGGGEYRPIKGQGANDPQDSHRNAQIFSPPYLFKGPRPQIDAAPDSVEHGVTFEVRTPQAAQIDKVSWVRTSSVTHSFNMNQRMNVLAFKVGGGTLKVTAPSANQCPPGHYLLFLISDAGVPSVAKIVQVKPAAPAAPLHAAAVPAAAPAPAGAATSVALPSVAAGAEAEPLSAIARQAQVRAAAKGTPVLVGITGTCPYGIGACWGGAHEALLSLPGVEDVDPIPDAVHSTATVFLAGKRLPDLDGWQEQFTQMVNGSYELRGVEVTLDGQVKRRNGELMLKGTPSRPAVRLTPIAPEENVHWDTRTSAPVELTDDETAAYDRLAADVGAEADGRQATVTGPLTLDDSGYRLAVRRVEV